MKIRRCKNGWIWQDRDDFGVLTLFQCITLSMMDLDYHDYDDELAEIFQGNAAIINYFEIGFPEI